MTRAMRWGAGVIAVLATGAIIATLAFHHMTAVSTVRRRLSDGLAAASDSAYRVTVAATSSSLFGRRFTASGIVVEPDSAVLVRRRKAGAPERTRFAVRIAAIHLERIDLWSLLRGRIRLGRMTIDSLELGASLDRTGPRDPDRGPARLPHQLLQAIRKPIQVDTVRLVGGSVRYTERARDGARPGTIGFDDIGATFADLTNESNRAAEHPAVIEIASRLAGSGRLRIRLRYDLASPDLNLVYRGSVAGLDGRHLNPMLIDTEGLRIRHGVIDSAWFDVGVRDDLAAGRVTVLYHDLESELLDKVTHERGLGKKLKTFIANKLTLRTDNERSEDGSPMVASVELRRAPSMSLFGFVWGTLRQGLLATVMGKG